MSILLPGAVPDFLAAHHVVLSSSHSMPLHDIYGDHVALQKLAVKKWTIQESFAPIFVIDGDFAP